jgi:hypothetical protein
VALGTKPNSKRRSGNSSIKVSCTLLRTMSPVSIRDIALGSRLAIERFL